MAGLLNKRTDTGGLSWAAARQVNLCTCLPEFYVYRDLSGFSPAFHPDSLNNTLLSPRCVLGAALVQGRRRENTFQGQGQGSCVANLIRLSSLGSPALPEVRCLKSLSIFFLFVLIRWLLLNQNKKSVGF